MGYPVQKLGAKRIHSKQRRRFRRPRPPLTPRCPKLLPVPPHDRCGRFKPDADAAALVDMQFTGVIFEIDIWRAANLMLKRYGGKAFEENSARADELAAGSGPLTVRAVSTRTYRFLGLCRAPTSVGWDDCAIETAFYPNLSAWIKASGCPMVAEANELFPLPIATRSEIVHQTKRGRAAGEEAGASGCGRCTKSVARIQKRSSRRSVTPAA